MTLRIEREFIDAWRQLSRGPVTVENRAEFLAKAYGLGCAPPSETSWPIGVETILVLMKAFPHINPVAYGPFRRAMDALTDGLEDLYCRPALGALSVRHPYKEG